MDEKRRLREPSAVRASSFLTIIPGLPNEIAVMVLARLPRALHASFCRVCRAWKDALQPSAMSALRNTLHISEMWILFFFRDKSIALYDSRLQRLSSRTPYFCESDRFIEVLGASGSQMFFQEDPHDSYSESQIHCFDAASMQWQPDFIRLWNNAVIYDPASAVVDGHLYLAAGAVDSGLKILRNVGRLDLKSRRWQMMPKMHERRIRAAAVVLQGRLLVIGGTNDDEDEELLAESGEMWDPQSGKWALVPELLPAHLSPTDLARQVAVVMDTLYVLKDDVDSRHLELFRYVSASKLWTSLGRPPAKRYSCKCNRWKIGNARLVGVGKELRVVLNCVQGNASCRARILSCVPTAGSLSLLWRLEPITSSANFPSAFAAVNGIVHV